MQNIIANASSRMLQAIGSRLGYHSSPARNRLELTPAALAYVDAGLLQLDNKTISTDDLRNEETARKAKLLSLLPGSLVELMTLNKTRIRQYSYTLEPNTNGYMPVKMQFGQWNSQENQVTIYETADQILEMGGKWMIPLLHAVPKMRDVPAVFSIYQRYGFNMADVAFVHEAGHMLHFQDTHHNRTKSFRELVEDTPLNAALEARDRLSQFANPAGLDKLKQEFHDRFPDSRDWKKLREVARAFRFALDIDSPYLQQTYPSHAGITHNETARRFPQIAEVVATTYALKQTIFRDQPELLHFMLPKLGEYIDVLEKRAVSALRARQCEALADPGSTHSHHAAALEETRNKEACRER